MPAPSSASIEVEIAIRPGASLQNSGSTPQRSFSTRSRSPFHSQRSEGPPGTKPPAMHAGSPATS